MVAANFYIIYVKIPGSTLKTINGFKRYIAVAYLKKRNLFKSNSEKTGTESHNIQIT